MLNACVECHREGVIKDLEQLDASMIIAIGVAPFRGGPIRYARERAVHEVVEEAVEEVLDTLESLAQHYGDRFLPDRNWKDM